MLDSTTGSGVESRSLIPNGPWLESTTDSCSGVESRSLIPNGPWLESTTCSGLTSRSLIVIGTLLDGCSTVSPSNIFCNVTISAVKPAILRKIWFVSKGDFTGSCSCSCSCSSSLSASSICPALSTIELKKEPSSFLLASGFTSSGVSPITGVSSDVSPITGVSTGVPVIIGVSTGVASSGVSSSIGLFSTPPKKVSKKPPPFILLFLATL